LTYAITVENSGGAVATLYADDVQETVPANTSHAGSDDFSCATPAAGSACGNSSDVNVPAFDGTNNGSVTLLFSVQIDNPLSAAATSIDNAVTVPDVTCTDPGNDCTEST